MKKLKELARGKDRPKENGSAKDAEIKDKSARKQQKLSEQMAKEQRDKEAALEYERQLLESARFKIESRVSLHHLPLIHKHPRALKVSHSTLC